MKTPYLDKEIELLEGFKDNKEASFYQSRKLAEYREIKQLIMHSVVEHKSYGFEKTIKMKRFLKYLRALRLYFVIRETRYWHRNSTNEWVFEVNTQVVGEYSCISRYPHKFKFMTFFVWLRYFWINVNDLCNYA